MARTSVARVSFHVAAVGLIGACLARIYAAAPVGTSDPRVSFFVTSTGTGASGGNLGGLAGADQRCQNLATAAGLPGSAWAAYLSTSLVNARDRIGPGPWYNWSGTLIAIDVATLHANGLAAAAALDEFGNPVPSDRHDILTGASQSGSLHPLGANCGDFQTSSASSYTAVGHSNGGGVGQGGVDGNSVAISWNSAHLVGCDQAGLSVGGGDGRSYCFLTQPAATSTPTRTATPSPTHTPTSTPSLTPTRTPTPSAGPIDDIDGDGDTDPLTDGLLKLRWMFDFRDSSLVLGAVDEQHCSRCTDDDIEDYLSSIEQALDIDGDGATEPLTDGLLNLRWLFGFRGDALILGAVDTQHCLRCSAEDIDDYIQSLN